MEKLKLSDDGRYFHHHFEEIQPFAFAPDGSIIYPESDRKLLVEFIVAHANEAIPYYSNEHGTGDFTVYTGAGGIWLMFERLLAQSDPHHHNPSHPPGPTGETSIGSPSNRVLIPELTPHVEHFRAMQLQYLAALETMHTKYYSTTHSKERFTFHEGLSGMNAILTLHYDRIGAAEKADKFFRLVLDQTDLVLEDPSDEILYGRAGYLLSLLFLRKRVPRYAESIDKCLPDILREMIDSGRDLGGKECPLFYKWHDKSYLGAAHGLTGILHTMLLCPAEVWQPYAVDIMKSIDRVSSLVESNDGNLFSSLESKNLKLCQWCHGPPGEIVWKKGLLQKGPGLCHGVSGNAYVFLTLFRMTRHIKYLNRAYQFVRGYDNKTLRSRMNTPDAPESLYEGIAGIVLLAADILAPSQSAFPAFEDF